MNPPMIGNQINVLRIPTVFLRCRAPYLRYNAQKISVASPIIIANAYVYR
jgi:hypothetical protein